jgi:hypothetical protein
MTTRPRIFLSAVSAELRTGRQAVARTVRMLGYDAVSQDDFPTGYGELRQWLREQIDGCEGLIQLVGAAYGAEPPEADPDEGRVSYTQFELHYAAREGKKIWVIVIDDQCHRDTAVEELDLPDNAGRIKPAAARAYQVERRALQQAYVARLKHENYLRHRANNDTELENIVLKLRDELAEMHLKWEAWFDRDASFKAQSLARLDELNKAAQLTPEKIRAHLLTTIEETHSRELAEANAASDWRERQRRREAVDAAHAARLLRIDELALSFAEIEERDAVTSVFQDMSRILAEQGVDEAIAYVAGQRPSILQSVRARAAAARERNRSELEPLLRTATLYDTKGQPDVARSLYNEILEIEANWPQALYATFWFLTAQGDQARSYASLGDARRDYEEAHRLAQRVINGDPSNTEWQRDLSVSHNKIGDVLVAHGDGSGALAAYRKSLEIAEALVGREPANTEWQRDLSVSHDGIGGVLVAQGDGPGAMAAYRKSLEIREALAGRDPANTGWQRDLSLSHNRIGDVLVTQGDGPEALAAYRKSLEIGEALVGRDPAKTEWQRDLSVSHERIGNVLVAQGDGPGALAAYHKSLAIAEVLARRDPANTEWQRDLSLSHIKIGVVLVTLGDGPGALAAYRKSLEICDELAGLDPSNTGWQRNLSVSHNRIGDVLVAQGDGPGALAAHRKSLAIAEVLARRDPANTEWQRDLSLSHIKIGVVLVTLGDGPGALAAYRKSLEIREAQAGRDPTNTAWQRDLSVSLNGIGDVLVTQGDGPGAMAVYRKSLEICDALAGRDPANTGWQVDVAVSCSKLGSHTGLPVGERRVFLLRGRTILQQLKDAGRLHANQDWVNWFDRALGKLSQQ